MFCYIAKQLLEAIVYNKTRPPSNDRMLCFCDDNLTNILTTMRGVGGMKQDLAQTDKQLLETFELKSSMLLIYFNHHATVWRHEMVCRLDRQAISGVFWKL